MLLAVSQSYRATKTQEPIKLRFPTVRSWKMMKKCAQSAVKCCRHIFRHLSDKVLDAEADGFSAQFLKGSCSGITVYHSVSLFSRKITAMRTVSRTFRGLRHCYGRKHSAMPCGRSDVPAVHFHSLLPEKG